MSGWENVMMGKCRLGNCPRGNSSCWENVSMGLCPGGKMSCEKVSAGILSTGKLSRLEAVEWELSWIRY